ncbi:MAG: large conductance mechanosensitive channel protein MscL [Terriglobales bacterium]
MKGFKQFLLRGNVVDLAVGVVIGAAFGAVVTGFVKDLLTPFIAAIAGKPDFSAYSFEINGSKFLYGAFVNDIISFLLIAAAVYFFIVVPMNKLVEWSRKTPSTPDPTTKKCPECLSEIPIDARRCAHCTTALGAITGA